MVVSYRSCGSYTLEDGTDRLSQNAGTKLLNLLHCVNPKIAQILSKCWPRGER